MLPTFSIKEVIPLTMKSYYSTDYIFTIKIKYMQLLLKLIEKEFKIMLTMETLITLKVTLTTNQQIIMDYQEVLLIN